MSMGVGCNMLFMILLRVYVYQVNYNIWVCYYYCVLLFVGCFVYLVAPGGVLLFVGSF